MSKHTSTIVALRIASMTLRHCRSRSHSLRHGRGRVLFGSADPDLAWHRRRERPVLHESFGVLDRRAIEHLLPDGDEREMPSGVDLRGHEVHERPPCTARAVKCQALHGTCRAPRLGDSTNRLPPAPFGSREGRGQIRVSFVTLPIGTHSTTRIEPSERKVAECGWTNLPGMKSLRAAPRRFVG